MIRMINASHDKCFTTLQSICVQDSSGYSEAADLTWRPGLLRRPLKYSGFAQTALRSVLIFHRRPPPPELRSAGPVCPESFVGADWLLTIHGAAPPGPPLEPPRFLPGICRERDTTVRPPPPAGSGDSSRYSHLSARRMLRAGINLSHMGGAFV
jgi:hypothetical protein